jgi:hypothetical protein
VAVAEAFVGALTAAVALSARELADLRLEGGLEEERDPEPSYLLEDVTELSARGKEFIDLGTDTLGGGYSS